MTRFFHGALDEIRIAASSPSVNRVSTLSRNYRDPRGFYGVGQINSAAEVNRSPVTPPTYGEATVGTTAGSEIDPVAATFDPDSGDTKTLTVADAVGGVVSIVSNRVRLLASVAGIATATATVTDSGGKSSTARLLWVVNDAPPPTDRPQRPVHYSALPPSRVRTVGWTNPGSPAPYATIDDAYAACVAGDQIVLNDGIYTGPHAFSTDFATGNPVVITSRNVRGSTFAGRLNFERGTSHWLYDVICTYQGTAENDAAVTCGNWFTATKCWMKSRRGFLIASFLPASDTKSTSTYTQRHHVWLGWNRHTGQAGTTTVETSHIKIFKRNQGPTSIAVNDQFTDIYLYRNFFSDHGPTPPVGESNYDIYLGNTKVEDDLYPGMGNNRERPRFSRFIIEENYTSPGSVRQRQIYLKNGITGCYRNHQATPGRFPFSQRIGRGTQWWGNRCSGSAQWEMGGGGDPVLFTDMRRNAGGLIDLGCGSWKDNRTPTDPTAPFTALHQAADYYLLYGNNCTVQVGSHPSGQDIEDSQGGSVNNVRIYANTGVVNYGTAAEVNKSTCTEVAGNPLGLSNPPVVQLGVCTDANGTVLSSFGEINTGLEFVGQD